MRALAEVLVQARGTLGLDDEQLAELDTHVEAMRDGKDDGHMRRALTWVGGLARSTAAGALGQMLAAAAIALLGGGRLRIRSSCDLMRMRPECCDGALDTPEHSA